MTCPVDHKDATCGDCGADHVAVGWAHLCRACWDAHVAARAPDEVNDQEHS